MWEKQKISHYDTNYILFGYFKARNFKNRMSYLKSTSSNLFICKILPKKKQNKIWLNLGPKMPYLGIFWVEGLKNYCHTWNQQAWIFLFGKSLEKN